MAAASARTPQSSKRKGRAAGTARPSLKLHSNSANTDTASLLRLQRLFSLGITGAHATIIASMAWEAGA